ncbi:peptidoglycan-recognition protein LA-like isoform X4 [Diabrotica undecimpunctata]|uniref:peptidoglycan-recognition protein LA-like isoform X4 n=1 Tax=Diabrotica undecimpunctata TaxID=50387 RepID=UPI003B635F95
MSHRFSYPSLMGPNLDAKPSELPNSDVALSEYDDGYNNAGLDVCNEFAEVANRELINRELVNLENAVVNIDNSNDVIIGPVTQFNVNGNVTIYQNKDGQPVEIEEKPDISTPAYTDVAPKVQKEDQEVAFSARKKCTLRIYLIGVLLVFLVSAAAVILVFVLRKNAQDQIPSEDEIVKLTNSSHRLIPKETWGGRPAIGPMKELKSPVGLVVLRHTAGGNCSNFNSCAKKMQTLQSIDMSDNNLPDIYFNFAVAGDGDVYYGRGWNILPASGEKRIEIVFLGNFAIDPFTPTMFEATEVLLNYGFVNKYLSEDYKLIAHNQLENTVSPGKHVMAVIDKLPHYDPSSHKGIPLLT